MKTKIIAIITILIALLSFVGCDNEDLKGSGVWKNDRGDLFVFIGDRLLRYENADPYYMILYDFYIEHDSIFLFPSHSSNLNDWKGYPIQVERKEFTLFQFNDIEKAVYKRFN